MAKSNAERQRAYRQKALKDPDGIKLKRLQVMISSEAASALERICDATGQAKKRMVEQALLEMERKIRPD